MSRGRPVDMDLDREMRAWMLDGPTAMSDVAIDEAVGSALRTRQRGASSSARRYLSMTTRSIARSSQHRLLQLAAAAAVVLALLAGGYAFFGFEGSIGNPAPATVAEFDAADLVRAVDAPAALDGLVVGEVPPDHAMIVEGSSFEALHLTLRTAEITHSGRVEDEQLRAMLTERLYTGLVSAKTRFYDAVGPGGAALPVTEPGGSSFMVIGATYVDSEAASEAFAAYVESYETWEFEGTEPWQHGEESVAFSTTQMDRPHGRCYVLASVEGCLQSLRVWRTGNLVVTVVAEGESSIGADDVVASIDDAATR